MGGGSGAGHGAPECTAGAAKARVVFDFGHGRELPRVQGRCKASKHRLPEPILARVRGRAGHLLHHHSPQLAQGATAPPPAMPPTPSHCVPWPRHGPLPPAAAPIACPWGPVGGRGRRRWRHRARWAASCAPPKPSPTFARPPPANWRPAAPPPNPHSQRNHVWAPIDDRQLGHGRVSRHQPCWELPFKARPWLPSPASPPRPPCAPGLGLGGRGARAQAAPGAAQGCHGRRRPLAGAGARRGRRYARGGGSTSSQPALVRHSGLLCARAPHQCSTPPAQAGWKRSLRRRCRRGGVVGGRARDLGGTRDRP